MKSTVHHLKNEDWRDCTLLTHRSAILCDSKKGIYKIFHNKPRPQEGERFWDCLLKENLSVCFYLKYFFKRGKRLFNAKTNINKYNERNLENEGKKRIV